MKLLRDPNRKNHPPPPTHPLIILSSLHFKDNINLLLELLASLLAANPQHPPEMLTLMQTSGMGLVWMWFVLVELL